MHSLKNLLQAQSKSESGVEGVILLSDSLVQFALVLESLCLSDLWCREECVILAKVFFPRLILLSI